MPFILQLGQEGQRHVRCLTPTFRQQRPVETVQQRPLGQPGRPNFIADGRHDVFTCLDVARQIRIRLQFQHQTGCFIPWLGDKMQQFPQSGHPDTRPAVPDPESAAIFGVCIQAADIKTLDFRHCQRRHADVRR